MRKKWLVALRLAALGLSLLVYSWVINARERRFALQSRCLNALEMPVNPDQNGILLSATVSALRPAAEAGNLKAIDFLATVCKDQQKQPLWMLVADALATPAESGNAVAVDGLAAMTVATNQYVRNAVILGLKRAAADQNPEAAEAPRSIGVQ